MSKGYALIFHHTDNDGYGAGKVCLNKCREEGYDDFSICTQPVNLNGHQIDDICAHIISISETKDIECVYIVDISMSHIEDMDKIADACKQASIGNVIWVDHHKTSYEMVSTMCEHKENTLEGALLISDTAFKYYISTQYSAARLAWMLLFPDTPIPQVIELISDHDIFAHELEGSIEFFNGSGLYDLSDIRNTFWDLLIADGPDWGDHIDMVIETGETTMAYNYRVIFPMLMSTARYFSLDLDIPFGSTMRFENCIAVNTSYGNSAIFGGNGEGYKEYDICFKYHQNGEGNWTYTMYSNKHDVSHIAKYLGGGGHPGAAGFTLPYNMFDPVRDQEKIYGLIAEHKRAVYCDPPNVDKAVLNIPVVDRTFDSLYPTQIFGMIN